MYAYSCSSLYTKHAVSIDPTIRAQKMCIATLRRAESLLEAEKGGKKYGIFSFGVRRPPYKYLFRSPIWPVAVASEDGL